MGKFQDLTGQRFGRLIALEVVGKNSKNESIWKCQCDCGNTTEVLMGKLVHGRTKSCGCYRRDFKKYDAKYNEIIYRRLYCIWSKMRQRCLKPYCEAYKDYGGRGITICKEWEDFNNFRDWALSNGYRDDLTIDRIDNDGNYEPSNCRWATMLQQQNNKRNNRLLTYNGITMTFSDWARELGIENSTLYQRLERHSDNLDIVFYKGDRRYEKRNG